MNIETFKEALPYLFEANVAAMVVGHHGIGKSQAVAQFCEEEGYEFIDLRLGTQDVGDLLGLADFETDEKGNKIATKFMRPEWFPTNPKSKGVIFLDEINRARRDVLQAVFQLVLDKKLHRYHLPKGWHVIAAMNPSTDDYIVTDISDKAFMDRFCHIKLAPSKQEFFKYARKTDVAPEIIGFLSDQPELLQGDLEEFSLEVKPSRRSWIAVNRLFNQKTPLHVFRELAAGLVGTVAASAFIKSLNDNDKPISAQDVLKNYPKFQKKVQEYSKASNARLDLLKFTRDAILEYGKDLKTALDEKESKNLADFLWDIPRDLSFDMSRELYMMENCKHVIEKHTDLISEIKSRKAGKSTKKDDKE